MAEAVSGIKVKEVNRRRQSLLIHGIGKIDLHVEHATGELFAMYVFVYIKWE